MPSNAFCRLEDLTNESSVEQFFVARLLHSLEYDDSQIRTKESIENLKVSTGRKKSHYRPDFMLMVRRRARVVVDAKAPSEDLAEWEGQCRSYCMEINKKYSENPVEFFCLTNGVSTVLYRWDIEKPILVLEFADFRQGNSKLAKLENFIGQRSILRGIKESTAKPGGAKQFDDNSHYFKKASISEVNSAFAWCHQHIYKKDNISQGPAFMEFIKLMFLKLLSDKAVHAQFPEQSANKEFSVPKSAVKFSLHWISERLDDAANPMAEIAFVQLRNNLENQIASGNKKRIYEINESLRLSPETIQGVVEKLEDIDLYSIDADLNGRLFETFLNATMRGKDLGQYFTPRSIVKLMVYMGDVASGKSYEDFPVVLDPCCGSGGFLIDVLWIMWQKVDANTSLSEAQKRKIKAKIATHNLVGIDVGREPPIARIARINMYLHGDGGSRIYQADALDKKVVASPALEPERRKELDELRDMVREKEVNLIITNPPFSKMYQSKHAPEKLILSDYKLASEVKKGVREVRASQKSSVLFHSRQVRVRIPDSTGDWRLRLSRVTWSG